MTQQLQPIEYGKYYHIYNRGNNGCDVFLETESYNHFLRLYEKYIDPIAETYAWCLLKNHFHVLVRIKNETEINKSQFSYSTTMNPKVIHPSRQFSHLFNSYTQAINKRFNRTGSLFEGAFERKLVTSEEYFQKLIFYIHNNPVHHGFVGNMIEYPWSSYLTMITTKPTKVSRSEVLNYYGDLENFIYFHEQKQNLSEIEELIIE
jgi:putative transposase